MLVVLSYELRRLPLRDMEVMERREYFRIRDVVQLALKVLPKGSPCPLSNQVYHPFHGLGVSNYLGKAEELDKELLKVLTSIDKKLDAILEYLIVERAGFLGMEHKEVDLSAGGLSLETDIELTMGDIAEVKMVLNTSPPTYVILYGKVNRVEALGPGKKKVSMEFQNVGEDLRNVMVRYVLYIQRQMLSGSR